MKKLLVLVMTLALSVIASRQLGASAAAAPASPIRHVVIVMEENHSFDDIFGKFCAEVAAGQIVRAGPDDRCHGATVATLKNGSQRALGREPDFGLNLDHSVAGQQSVMDGGKMDGWDVDKHCRVNDSPAYACLTQFDPLSGTCGSHRNQNCTPNLDLEAEQYAISDRTFEFRATPSWAGHMVLGSATVEHFLGENPTKRQKDPGGDTGWGCDAGKSTPWYLSGRSGPTTNIPSCIPDRTGSLGPAWQSYSGTKADYVPTIFDRLDAAHLSWRIYYDEGARSTSAAGWAICPSFWECLGSPQHDDAVDDKQFFPDAEAGLPAVSIVVPPAGSSAHQPASVSAGDAWVGRVVQATMASPSWPSTAIFVSFDDCGCFYDDVNPLQYTVDWGPRVPMVIVSPYAKPGFTDSTPATSVSMLTFIERTFGLLPLNPCATEDSWDPHCTDDARDYNGQQTYDFSNAFDFSGVQAGRVPFVRVGVPRREKAWLAAHPLAGNEAT